MQYSYLTVSPTTLVTTPPSSRSQSEQSKVVSMPTGGAALTVTLKKRES